MRSARWWPRCTAGSLLTELFELSGVTLALLVLVAFAAGWVDAVVGGGGLIQLPALLIGLPDATPPATILGTNKVSSVWGTATSSITYAIKIRPDWRTIVPLVVASGSAPCSAPSWPLPAQGVLHPDRAGRADRGRDLHLAPTRARAGVGAQARRPRALRADGCDRPGGRRVRRVPRAGYRLVLRDLARQRAGIRVPGGQCQGQDRQSGDQPGGDRRLRRRRLDLVGARAGHGRGQSGRRAARRADRDQPRATPSSAGVPDGAGRLGAAARPTTWSVQLLG